MNAAPPASLEAEMALLGGLLADARVYDRVSDVVTAAMFADPRHGQIFDAVGRMVESGRAADPVTLKQHFEATRTLDDVGGAEYLARLAGAVVSIAHCRDYAGIVADRWQRRQIMAIAHDLAEGAADLDLDTSPREMMERAEAELADIAAAREIGAGAVQFATWSGRALESIEAAWKGDRATVGLSLGMTALDAAFGGLRGGEMLVIGGRPSMGKTALAETIAENVAAGGRPVYAASAEMSGDEWATRTLARAARVNSWLVRQGRLDADKMQAIIAADRARRELPLYIDDEAAISAAAIRARARRLQRRSGLGLVVVDYLQRLSAPRGDGNRVQEVSRIARDLKSLAKQLDVPVVVLCQLSRAVEQRDNKKPQLSDLRETGEIEQEADIVAFLYREEYYLERAKPTGNGEKLAMWQTAMDRCRGRADLIVAKHRHGPVGEYPLQFDAATATFSDPVDEPAAEGWWQE